MDGIPEDVWMCLGEEGIDTDAKCIQAGECINAGRTLQHKPLSTTEGQRVVLMNVGSFTEIRGDSINSGHRWSKSGSYRRGLVPRRKNCPCDLMMGCASAHFMDGTARTSIIRLSLYFAHDAYRVSIPLHIFSTFHYFLFKCIRVPGMCPEPRWIDYPAPRSPAGSFVMAGPIRHCLLRAC